MDISQEKLNNLAIESTTFLADKLKSSINSIKIEKKEDYVDISLDNPSQPNKPLWISTDSKEITIAFAESHYHISSYNDETEEQLIEQMIIGIINIVSGLEKTYSAWKGEKCLGGGSLSAEFNDNSIKDKSFKDAEIFKIVAWDISGNNEIKNT